MIRRVGLTVFAAAVLGGSLVASLPVAAAPAAPATVVKDVRPVTTAGHASAGFRVKRETGVVDCGSPDPSPGAVSRNIEFCPPSYLQAVACWRSARPKHVLCMPDPSVHKVVRLRRHGKFARTDLAPPKQRAPLVMFLADGTKCMIRDGGAWGFIKRHPSWFGTYSCDRHGIVWAKQGMSHSGINESQPTWTVQTSNGSWPLTVRKVASAYFVGTSR